jgi:hypothetical protein
MQTSPQAQTSHVETSSMARLTWVLNRADRPYKAEFQGMQITIPPRYQKIAKHVRDGGNLMEYLAARKFIVDFKQPQEFTQKGEPLFFSKELIDEPLTEDELKAISGKSSNDLKKEAASDEKKVRRELKKALDKIPNKVAVADEE